MYRAVTWCVIAQNVDASDEPSVSAVAHSLELDVKASSDTNGYVVIADGVDITDCLRRPEVDQHVSVVSAYAEVRKAMTREQRRIGERGRVVMAGRDIGTVVLPDADMKIYLDAPSEVRASRRWKELCDKGEKRPLEVIVAETKARDRIDSGRLLAPLRPADDALVIDTTDQDAQEVLEMVWGIIEERRKAQQEKHHA
jgi:cytidylate kinase